VAQRGHEIGNHTLSHTCSRNFQAAIRPNAGLEAMTLEAIEADILAAEGRLREAFPGHGPRSFCYPCYMTHVGEGLTRQSYVPVVARHFVAGRAGGEYGFFNHPYNIDLHCLTSTSAQAMEPAELIGLVELAARRGHWCILTFHGIGVGRLGTGEYAFAELLDHLATRRDRLWTAPVATVAGHCAALRARVGSEGWS
jgi:peptidoglycan/xylan/chitin deacetylase (PgdA/CDA1 family)